MAARETKYYFVNSEKKNQRIPYHCSFSCIVISKLKCKIWHCLCHTFYTHLFIVREPVILHVRGTERSLKVNININILKKKSGCNKIIIKKLDVCINPRLLAPRESIIKFILTLYNTQSREKVLRINEIINPSSIFFWRYRHTINRKTWQNLRNDHRRRMLRS